MPKQSHRAASKVPPILAHAGPMLERYDVIFCDVWGVVHNGVTAFEGACLALRKFRERGGAVILVSNAPVPKKRVADMLDSRHVPREAWDDIVSSGDIALGHVEDRKFQRLYCIGPQDRDQALFSALNARSVELRDAEAIICTGLNDDRRETPDDYRETLEHALDQRLPFVCANPDLVVDVGGTLLYCAGAIADLYANMGGEVYWAGKPYLSAYEAAHHKAEALRNANVEKKRTLVIGDALRTDIKGAQNWGCDALFIASGIHRHETVEGIDLSANKLSDLFGANAPPAIGAMLELMW
ncbi:MAG: TIGR01459 family HAD-type hydrolase [Hyphomicrobium sp.]|uniref:TIGR01459 family HAD-type hydrolase n=1 Tax=Hyphomicrobium sp. TaxID=82 RepID=UPI0039E2BC08